MKGEVLHFCTVCITLSSLESLTVPICKMAPWMTPAKCAGKSQQYNDMSQDRLRD